METHNISGRAAIPLFTLVNVGLTITVLKLPYHVIATRDYQRYLPIVVRKNCILKLILITSFLGVNCAGVITDKNFLPVTRLNFGRTILDSSSGIHTLGRFECTGQVAVNGMPTSCEDLWKIGHTLSGLYSVMGAEMVETIYCDFTKLPTEPSMQIMVTFFLKIKTSCFQKLTRFYFNI